MLLSNLNNLTILIFFSLLTLGGLILWGIYKNENKKINIILLFLSFFFILINIFEIKGSYNNDTEIIDGSKIVFVLDVSKSMNTEDIKNNNTFLSRFETAKLLINSYISKYSQSEYGLIAFAGEALEILPFTSDTGTYKTILYGVNNGNVNKNGTNLNSVFESLNNYFINDSDGGLAVIFTDGGDEEINVSNELVNSLLEKGVKLMLVGVATETGGNIPNGTDFFGRKLYKSYEGNLVVSKLNNRNLKDISSRFNIGYISIGTIDEIEKINNYIFKNINLVKLEKDINYRYDFTRFFIFIAFSFFILYLFCSNFLGRKK